MLIFVILAAIRRVVREVSWSAAAGLTFEVQIGDFVRTEVLA